MKKVLFVFVLFFGSVIWPLPVHSVNLSSILVKDFLAEYWSGKIVSVKIEIVTPLTDIDTVQEIEIVKRLLGLHKQAVRSFCQRGWRERLTKGVITDYRAGSIIITTERRMDFKAKRKVIIKTSVLPCNADSFWNTVKYRGGGLPAYFDLIAVKTERCIKNKYDLSYW